MDRSLFDPNTPLRRDSFYTNTTVPVHEVGRRYDDYSSTGHFGRGRRGSNYSPNYRTRSVSPRHAPNTVAYTTTPSMTYKKESYQYMCEEYGTVSRGNRTSDGILRKPAFHDRPIQQETMNYNREDDYFELSSRDRHRRLDDDVFKVSRDSSLLPQGIDIYCNQLMAEGKGRDVYKSSPNIRDLEYTPARTSRPEYKVYDDDWPRAASRPAAVNRTLEAYQRSESKGSEPYGIASNNFHIPTESLRAEDYDILTPPRMSISNYDGESDMRFRHYDLPPTEYYSTTPARYYDQVPYDDYPIQPRIVPYTGFVESMDEVNQRYFEDNRRIDDFYNRYYFGGSPSESGLRGILKRSDVDGSNYYPGKTMANMNYATIIDNPDFNPPMVAEKIDRSLRAGDKESIVNLLTSLSNGQRQRLREPYKLKYGKELAEALDKKFSGDIETAVLALMDTPLEYDLKQLKKAMKGLGTDENALIEILCSRTPDQMRAIRAGYERDFGKQLEKEVAGDTSGEFRDLLVALVTGSRDASHETNDTEAKDDAVRLFADGKGKFKGEKGAPSHFLKILATQNQYQLRKVFAEYEKLSGVSIEKAIEKEFSGDLRNSYLTIARASTNKQRFFAIQLYNSMKGLGTRDNDLIRVLVTRSEVDLNIIKEEYKELYGKTLEEHIKGDTSGLYRDCLLKIVTGNYTPQL